MPAAIMIAATALRTGIHQGVAFRTFSSFVNFVTLNTTSDLAVGICEPSCPKGNPVTFAVMMVLNVKVSVFSCWKKVANDRM